MTDVSVPHKCCTKCGNEYPATRQFFTSAKSTKDGLFCRCKQCCKEYAKQHREKDPERAKDVARRTYLKHKERHIGASRQVYAENREELCRRQRERYARNAEDQREKARQRGMKNRVSLRLNHHRRESRKRSVEFNFTLEHQRLALDYFHGCCAVCGRQLYDLFSTHRLEWDHWQPLSKGGSTTPGNMLPLCGLQGGCNTRKRDSNPVGWLKRNYKPSQVKRILARIEAYFEWIQEQDIVEHKR